MPRSFPILDGLTNARTRTAIIGSGTSPDEPQIGMEHTESNEIIEVLREVCDWYFVVLAGGVVITVQLLYECCFSCEQQVIHINRDYHALLKEQLRRVEKSLELNRNLQVLLEQKGNTTLTHIQ